MEKFIATENLMRLQIGREQSRETCVRAMKLLIPLARNTIPFRAGDHSAALIFPIYEAPPRNEAPPTKPVLSANRARAKFIGEELETTPSSGRSIFIISPAGASRRKNRGKGPFAASA